MSSAAIQELQYKISVYQTKINEVQREIDKISKRREALYSLEHASTNRALEYYDIHQRQKASQSQLCYSQTIRYAEGHKRNLEGYFTGNPYNFLRRGGMR